VESNHGKDSELCTVAPPLRSLAELKIVANNANR